MREKRNIHDDARGRWKSLLPQLGVPAKYLTGKHGPCPVCGGKDRFRWDDQDGKGTYYCNGCGSGTGVDLVMKVNKVDFLGARMMIEPLLPSSAIVVPKATKAGAIDVCVKTWGAGLPITEHDPAGRYLSGRGIRLSEFPKMLRFGPRVALKGDDDAVTYHPALLARLVSADASEMTVQRIYLNDDGTKLGPKKNTPGKFPIGGAVRLAPSAETMGIAEGVETALSASLLFDVPVWAALTAGNLARWEPPPTAKNIIVFADADASYAGQYAAYALANRLTVAKLHVDVRIPEELDIDWNDLLVSGWTP